MSKLKRHYRLLAGQPIEKPKQTTAENVVNGSDSESFAAARFITACRGEVAWGSRELDNNKIDLILNFDHPWAKGEKLMVLAQVKSGPSYGEIDKGGVKIKTLAIEACQRTSHSICLIWVDRDTNKIFWAYVHPRTKAEPRVYGHHHQLTPAIRYDLARCMAMPVGGSTGASGITVANPNRDLQQQRSAAKMRYQKYRLAPVETPTLGLIHLTGLAWRHMFRAGRGKNYKERSLNLIRQLPQILKRFPDDQAIIASEHWESEGYQFRSIEHLLKYHGGRAPTQDPAVFDEIVVIVRVIEEIRFPIEWANKAMLSQEVVRRVVLRSAYYKPIKEEKVDSGDDRNSDKTLPKITKATSA
jgi:hypothetical protein